MSVQALMVRELVSKIVTMITAEIAKEKATEPNPDVRAGLQRAEDIIRKFEER